MLGKRLKEARKMAGITQEELADLVKIDTTASRISHYENETHSPSYELICRIGDKLNIPECWFYCKDERLADLILSYHRKNKIFHLSQKDVLSLEELSIHIEKLNETIRDIISKRDVD